MIFNGLAFTDLDLVCGSASPPVSQPNIQLFYYFSPSFLLIYLHFYVLEIAEPTFSGPSMHSGTGWCHQLGANRLPNK